MKCEKCGYTFFETVIPGIPPSPVCKLCRMGFAPEAEVAPLPPEQCIKLAEFYEGRHSTPTPEVKMTKKRDDLLRKFFS